MSGDFDERKWFFERPTDTTVVSRQLNGGSAGEKVRIASRVIDGQEGLRFAKLNKEIVIRATPAGRYQIKASFLEDDRSIITLTIQKFNKVSGPSDNAYFSLVGDEIIGLVDFINSVRDMNLEGDGKVHLSDKELREMSLDAHQVRKIFVENKELFLSIAQEENVIRDLVAVGYRRKQLDVFDNLLNNKEYFESIKGRLKCGPEGVWQRFFEKNTWIFGYGLAYQFLSKLDHGKLEQIVRGRDLSGAGKRADAVMKTRGIIQSLCFVEIKRHDTPLLGGALPYRPDVWPPSADLIGGVSQVQATVQAALHALGVNFAPRDSLGDPTGEELFNVEPRSLLVVGSLSQLEGKHGPNIPKVRSFELFRRNIWRPEIVTFDELLERARFIVEHPPDADQPIQQEG
ncbi:Shedu immune nuclease family protein [Xanthobacter sp. 91]|uniref:Shedu immune nuclease family protein n=1 Tax=Xanthobacter sp. 91 TaxID=1117244 RepID=UPI001FD98BFE|nr:Shedu immune nuclease family protein [Xanthobacter sp. 91]